MARSEKRAVTLRAIHSTAIACIVAMGCSRSGLDGFAASANTGGEPNTVTIGDAASTPAAATADAAIDSPEAAADATPPMPSGTSTVPTPTTTATTPTMPPACVPHDETCNGVDDDCNGQIDDGIAAIPCPGGGERYCVAGRMSACPTRCETCVPGSERVCFLSYCTFWAAQECAADGRSFGVCRERSVPSECKDVAERHKDSAELEQCCVDNGYCCRDEFDLDHDGNRNEMLGQCDEVSCGN